MIPRLVFGISLATGKAFWLVDSKNILRLPNTNRIFSLDGTTVTENTIRDVGHMWGTWTVRPSHSTLDGDACQSELSSTNFFMHLDFFMSIPDLIEINTSKEQRFELPVEQSLDGAAEQL